MGSGDWDCESHFMYTYTVYSPNDLYFSRSIPQNGLFEPLKQGSVYQIRCLEYIVCMFFFCHMLFLCPNGNFANPKPTCKSKSTVASCGKKYEALHRLRKSPAPATVFVSCPVAHQVSEELARTDWDGGWVEEGCELMASADNLIIWAVCRFFG